MEPLDVRVFLIAGPNDPNRELPQKLEPQAQKILKYRLNEEGTTYSFSVLLSTLTAWLVTGLGRKVRLEVEVIGEVKGKEVTSAEELKDLIGEGKTLQTFLEALASAGPLPAKKATTAA